MTVYLGHIAFFSEPFSTFSQVQTKQQGENVMNAKAKH